MRQDPFRSILAGIRDGADPGRIVHATTASVCPDRLARVRDVSWGVVRRGRRGGPLRQYLRAPMNLCLDDFLTGRWGETATQADEGLRLCEEHQYRFLPCCFQYHHALLAAVHGHFEESRALADRITQWAVPRGVLGAVACAGHARRLASLGEGDYESAYHHAVAISPAGRLASHVPHAIWACMDLVEAAVRTHRSAEAEAHVRAVRESGIADFSPPPAGASTGGLGRARGVRGQRARAFRAGSGRPGSGRLAVRSGADPAGLR
ncbi:hypothetical protein [Streptomyces sp. NPDC054940]